MPKSNTVLHLIQNQLIKANSSLATAESCTGGELSAILTRLPGSSRYFTLGIVSYSNKAKEDMLGIPAKLIAAKGAVSKETALKMARAARRLSGADFGLSITGVAGPTGGTLQKPVGTVFIAFDSKNKSIYRKFLFSGNRDVIRKKSVLRALQLLKSAISHLLSAED